MKKQISLILFACLLSGSAFSQTFQVVMSPRPSTYLSDWQTKTETITLIVNNTSGVAIDCKIKTQLYNGSGSLFGETNLSKMQLISLLPGINQFHADDIYPLAAIIFYGGTQIQIQMAQTGKIPEGNYNLCINLVNPTTGLPLTALPPQCKMFTIAAYQAPILISPRDNEQVLSTNISGILFRWTTVVPSPNFIVTYKLQIWEVPPGTNGVDAIRSTQPVVDKNYRGQTQAMWPTDFASPEVGKKYEWAITPVDDQERKIIDGTGMSAPFGFSVISAGNPSDTTTIPFNKTQKISLISPKEGSTYALWTDVSDTYKSNYKDSTHHDFSEETINFSWLDNIPSTTGYSLKIVKIEKGQTATQALKDNTAVFVVDGIKTNSYSVFKKLPNGDSSINFAWQISNGETKSDVGTFKGETKLKTIPINKPNLASLNISLVSPAMQLKEGDNRPAFKWTVDTAVAGQTYSLKVVEYKENQTPEDALKMNKSVFEEKGIKETSFRYPSSVQPIDTGKMYIYSVTAFDGSGKQLDQPAVSAFVFGTTRSIMSGCNLTINTSTPSVCPSGQVTVSFSSSASGFFLLFR